MMQHFTCAQKQSIWVNNSRFDQMFGTGERLQGEVNTKNNFGNNQWCFCLNLMVLSLIKQLPVNFEKEAPSYEEIKI